MHIDHVGGLPTLLSILAASIFFFFIDSSLVHPDDPHFTIDLYGPRGISSLVLNFWHATETHAECRVVFHELLNTNEKLNCNSHSTPSYK